jgi:hypothetical protein
MHYESLEVVSYMQKTKVVLWMNGPGDWSIELNHMCHEHISSATLEELVERALIADQNSFIETATASSELAGVEVTDSQAVPKLLP